MGTAFYPSFDHVIEGYEPATALDGKALGRHVETLDAACPRLGVLPLLSFYSESIEEAFEKIGEPVPQDIPCRPIKWTDPVEGIRTIDALLNDEESVVDDAAVKRDLEELKQALLVAKKHGLQFRLCADI